MRAVLTALLFCFLSVPAQADVTAIWEYGGGPDLAGFRLYYGESSGVTTTMLYEIPYVTDNITLPDLPEGYYTLTAYDTDGLESDPSNEVIVALYYYNSIRYDYDDKGRVIYKGEHTAHDASESDTEWVITRYYYSSKGTVAHVRRRTTSWTNRATGW